MKHFILLALLYTAAVLQLGHLFPEHLSYLEPRWVWLLMFLNVRLMEKPAVLCWGAAIGLCADCLGSNPLGLQLICGVIFAGILSDDRSQVASARPLRVGIAAFLMVTLTEFVHVTMSVLFQAESAAMIEWRNLLAPALATMGFAVVTECLRGGFARLFSSGWKRSPVGYSLR
ncbi:MAG: rod shape-determining protein MreD [Planctomycetaceae bacterium]